jgi:hypothetical protein
MAAVSSTMHQPSGSEIHAGGGELNDANRKQTL